LLFAREAIFQEKESYQIEIRRGDGEHEKRTCALFLPPFYGIAFSGGGLNAKVAQLAAISMRS
jgi:hypothetical protein